MNPRPADGHESGIFNSRAALAFTLCFCAVILGGLSFAAPAPVKRTSAGPSGPSNPANLLSNFTSGGGLNAPGLPLPYGRQLPFKVGAYPSTVSSSNGQSRWSVAIPPEAKGTLTDNNLNSVTCLSASDCWAVGAYMADGGAYQTLIEHWGGTAWAIIDSPNTDPTLTNFLYSVTCQSSSDCWAVGASLNASKNGVDTLIEHWDGNSWSIVTSPDAVGGVFNINILSGVTCSPTACWAVGYAQNSNTEQTLIEQWNGGSWSVAISPDASVLADFLNYVTCTSDSDCLAVGASYNGQSYQTLIERWNGVVWTIAISANSSPTTDNGLLSATCASSTDCWAVGVFKDANGVYQSLIESWDGTTWTIAASPTFPTQDNELESVMCAFASNCWAVGKYYNSSSSADQTLAEHWDGNVWAIVNSPNSNATEYNELAGLTCASTSNCLAVGYHSQGAFSQNLTERWDGTSWTIVSSPNHLPTQAWNIFSGVACLSTFQCWAAGYYTDTETGQLVDQTVTEYWNGVSWAIVPSVNTSTEDTNHLLGITCVAASDCWAVGEYQSPGNNSNTLIERWDGSSWAVVSSPNPRPNNINQLRGVTCTSASDCWAVGIFYDSSANVFQTLIEHWDGSSWTIANSENTTSTQDKLLNSVTCASASECWAVGYYNDGNFDHTLIEQWNGSSWTIVSSPNSSATSWNMLNAVTCTSTSDCWAVGNYISGANHHPLTEHWDGTSWTIATSPDGNANNENFLNGVTCASASECWAVGYYNDGSYNRTLIEQWNGISWTVVSSPNAIASSDNELRAVSCASAFQCSAVGDYANNGIFHALTEFIAPVQLVDVVSRKVHGDSGTFDIDLTNGNGIECRSGGANGDYTLVFTFANPLTSVDGASVTTGTGNVSANGIGPNPNQYTIDLTGVADAEHVTVSLTNVTDSAGNFSSSIAASMGVLLGDVDATGRVDGNDVSAVQSHTRQAVDSTNFRYDVNTSGLIDGNDVSITQGKTRTSLP
jgi:hypothetical protein